jgi:hypothetical protein
MIIRAAQEREPVESAREGYFIGHATLPLVPSKIVLNFCAMLHNIWRIMALQVNVDQTMDFAERWRMNGIFVSLPPAAIQFACDWANIVLTSFIEEQVKRIQAKKEAAAKAAQEQEAAPMIILTGADS